MSEFSLLEPYLSFCIIEAGSENIATPLAVNYGMADRSLVKFTKVEAEELLID